MRAAEFAAILLALPGCQDASAPAKQQESPTPPDMSGDWRDYFGVVSDALTPDTAKGDVIFQCPVVVDVDGLLGQLWPIWERQQSSLPRPLPPDLDAQAHLEQPMHDAIRASGCEPFNGKLEANGVIATAAAHEPDIYRNAERWIAFAAVGHEGHYFVMRNNTVD